MDVNMTSWGDLLDQFDPSTHEQAGFDFYKLADAANLSYSRVDFEQADERIAKYFINGATSICTDTRVGLAVYTLDRKIVAVSEQSCRKCDEDIQFLGKDEYERTRAAIEQMSFQPTVDYVNTNIILPSKWFKVIS